MAQCNYLFRTRMVLFVCLIKLNGILTKDFEQDSSFFGSISDTNKITATSSQTAIQCATKCSVYSQCASFFFNSDRSLCQLHDLVLAQNFAALTEDPGTRYYRSGVALDCMTIARLYTGRVAVTETGRTCQVWTTTTPHNIPNEYPDINKFPDDSFTEMKNYCRAPVEPNGFIDDGAWCYTTDPSKEWEYCTVPVCP